MMAQAIALGKRPHVIVGTPGRVVDHLTNTKVGVLHCDVSTKWILCSSDSMYYQYAAEDRCMWWMPVVSALFGSSRTLLKKWIWFRVVALAL